MVVHGTTARFYWHTRDWSPYVESAELAMTRSTAEHRPLSGNSVRRKLGHRATAVTLGGAAWERATVDANAWARFDESASRPWVYLPNGDTVGAIAYCGLALDNNEQRVAGDDIVRLPVGLVGTDKLDRGVVLRALAAGGSSPGSSVNGGVQPLLVGNHDGADNVAVLTDADGNWTVDALIGWTLTNTTDGSSGLVTANTATTITARLAGGTQNDWDTNDAFTLTPLGGAAYLLCTAISGAAANLAVVVQDSANNVDWATLVSMTAVTAVGSEQKLVAGIVRRYLRVSWTLTGTNPSATWFMAFGRR